MHLSEKDIESKLVELLVTTWVPLSCLEAAHLTLPPLADPMAGVSLYRNCIVLKHLLISGEILDAYEWAHPGRWTLTLCDGSGHAVKVVHNSKIPLFALALKGHFCQARGKAIFRPFRQDPGFIADFVEFTEPNWFPTAMKVYSRARSVSVEILQPAALLLAATKMTQVRAKPEQTIRDSMADLPKGDTLLLSAQRLLATLGTVSR